jgi:hypothetical protein
LKIATKVSAQQFCYFEATYSFKIVAAPELSSPFEMFRGHIFMGYPQN